MVLRARLRAADWGAGGNPDKEAKCRKHPLPKDHDVNPDTDPFFYDEEEASHICNGTYDDKVCPFRARCLEWGLINNDQHGTFGGLVTIQRRWVRRNREDIPRDTWDDSDAWRDQVPPVSFFSEEVSVEGEEEADPEVVA